MLLSVIVPCYNEESVVRMSYEHLTAVMRQTDMDYELIFVNDGSVDQTVTILKELSQEDAAVKVIDLARNFGHQCAITAGVNNCKGDLAVIIDSDLQDPPEVILDMLEIQKRENANVVYGVRKKRDGETWFKLLTAKCYYRILNRLSEVQFPVDTGDFRLIDRNIIDGFNSLHEKNKYVRGLISWMGYKQVPCYYNRKERLAGETHYSLRKMIGFAVAGLFGFSKRPIKFASILGALMTIFSLLGALAMLIVKIINPTLSFSMGLIAMLILFVGGLQFVTIGILGEYLVGVFDESKGRPEYIIREKINF